MLSHGFVSFSWIHLFWTLFLVLGGFHLYIYIIIYISWLIHFLGVVCLLVFFTLLIKTKTCCLGKPSSNTSRLTVDPKLLGVYQSVVFFQIHVLYTTFFQKILGCNMLAFLRHDFRHLVNKNMVIYNIHKYNMMILQWHMAPTLGNLQEQPYTRRHEYRPRHFRADWEMLHVYDAWIVRECFDLPFQPT